MPACVLGVRWGSTCLALPSVLMLGAHKHFPGGVGLPPPATSSEIKQLLIFHPLSCLELSEQSEWKVMGCDFCKGR